MDNQKIIITNQLRINLILKRKESGITAYGLSEKVGKNKTWLPNIEAKKTKKIKISDLEHIATALQCRVEDLVEDDKFSQTKEENENFSYQSLLQEISDLKEENNLLRSKLNDIYIIINS